MRRRALPTALAAALIVVGLNAPGGWKLVAINVVVQALLALSVGMLFFRSGMLALCPLSFAAIAVWVICWLSQHTSLPFVPMLLAGAAATIPAGALLGALACRLRGVQLAVLTLTFAAALDAVFTQNSFPGQLSGAPIDRPVGFASDRLFFLFCVIVLALVGVGLAWYDRRRGGHAWRAVLHSERAAAVAGLRVPAVKIKAFVVSGVIAGLAGGLIAGELQSTPTPNTFEPINSMVVAAVAVVAGAAGISGAVVAGILAAVVPETFSRLGWSSDFALILFAIGAVQALAAGTGGISAGFPWLKPTRSDQRAPTRPPAPVAGRAAVSTRRPALEIEQLGVTYGAVQALTRVDLVIPHGAIVGVIGPNGAGKSTLVDAVCGFSRYAGGVSLDGRSLERHSATARARLGLRRTFQQSRVAPNLCVGDYVGLYASQSPDHAELSELLGTFALPPADEPIVFVDVGTRRVLEVAACLAAKPTVLFLDEPLAGLGTPQAALLADRIREIPARFGCAVLLIEHHVDVVASVCQQVTVLDFGVVIAEGTPQAVLADARVAEAYLGDDVGVAPETLAGRGG